MGNSLVDLFRSETEFDVKASEMYGLMREATKAEFLLNAVKCDVPHTYARQIATGEKEDTQFIMGVDLSPVKEWTPWQQDTAADKTPEPAEGQDVRTGSGSVGIIRKHEQRVEWIDIQDIIRKGRAPVSLPVGTEIHFTLKNGEIAVVAVAALNHYEERDAVFHFRRIIGRHCMNQDNKNAGGWHDSDARRYINKELIRLLPDELVAVIAEHESVQSIDGMKVESIDRLFLPSEYETKGANDYAEYNGTDKQLPLFEERIKRIVVDDDGDPVWWWTADPSAADATNFCIFNLSGGGSNGGAAYEFALAPLFVIR